MVGISLLINGNVRVHFSSISNQLDRSHLPGLKPTVITVTNTRPYWASLQADVEAHLKQTIPIKHPSEVFEPMHHLTFAAAKTTVPALCLAACELVGGQRQQAMAAASALLLIQAATYTHEHLPLTDRPGPEPKATGSHAYRPNIELLTGDGLVPFGFELLARSNDSADGNSERILRVIIEISRAVGSEQLIDAQYRKTLRSRSDGEEMRHVESIKAVVEKKEGGMHACGAACGAVLGGGSEEEIGKLRNFGYYVGIMQGMLQLGLSEEVEDARNLALQELNFFKDREVDAIASFVYL